MIKWRGHSLKTLCLHSLKPFAFFKTLWCAMSLIVKNQ